METRIPTLTPVLDAHFFCLKPMLQFRDQVPKFADLPKALGGSGLIASELSVQATAERVFTGQCLCTSVQIVVSEPEHSVFLCHCRQCQSWTGSLGSYAVLFHEKDVQIIGSLVEVEGKMACATCFSRISSKDHAGTGLIALCGGVLNSPPAVQMHLHYGQRVLCLSCSCARADRACGNAACHASRKLRSVKDRVAKFNDAPVEQGGSGTLLGKDACALTHVSHTVEPSAKGPMCKLTWDLPGLPDGGICSRLPTSVSIWWLSDMQLPWLWG